MLDTKNSKLASDTQNSLGLKGFNAVGVGSEDTTFERIKPRATAAQKQQTVLLLGVMAVLLVIVALLAFQRSGLRFSDATQEDNGPAFAPGARPVDSTSDR